MAKGIYVGVGGVARKAKPYVGVGGAARKVKKVYIGVGGVPRITYNSEINYIGAVTPLSVARTRSQAGANNNYALIMSGAPGYGVYTYVDAYDALLTKSTPRALSDGGSPNENYGGSVGDYVWFAPASSSVSTITAYNGSLVVSNVAFNSIVSYSGSDDADTLNYSFMCIGSCSYSAFVVRILSKTLVVSQPPTASSGNRNARDPMCGTDGHAYVIASGGTDAGLTYGNNKAGAWNASNGTVYGSISDLSVGRFGGKGAGNKNYSIVAGGTTFSGGTYGTYASSSAVDAYDTNLVHFSTSLTEATYTPIGVYTPDNAYFMNGSMFNSFDKQLVRNVFAAAPYRTNACATTFQDDKLIYAGGYYYSPPSEYFNNVDLYNY